MQTRQVGMLPSVPNFDMLLYAVKFGEGVCSVRLEGVLIRNEYVSQHD